MVVPARSICCCAGGAPSLDVDPRPAASHPGEPTRLGIERSTQPGCCDARKAQSQGAATAWVERRRARLAQQGSAELVRQHQATFLGDQRLWKVGRDREIKTICKIAVGRPLVIGPEIGDRALDLDNQEIASLAKPKDIGAAPVGQRKFDEAGIAELVERTADTAGQERGGQCGFDDRRSGHGGLRIIGRTRRRGEIDGV